MFKWTLGGNPPSSGEAITAAYLQFGVTVRVDAEVLTSRLRLVRLVPTGGTTLLRIRRHFGDVALRLGVLSTASLDMANDHVIMTIPSQAQSELTIAGTLGGRVLLPCEALVGQGFDGKSETIYLPHAPHVLVAGSTGSGKTVTLHCMIRSLAQFSTPKELRMAFVDLKAEEFSRYESLPHNAGPVVTCAHGALEFFSQLWAQMEDRYRKPKNELATVVVFVDEFADLISQVPQLQEHVLAIAQKSRGAKIHLVLATQRPSVRVLTGDLKVNFPVRVALKVPTKTDSRVILDQNGAEHLLGRGDALLLQNGELIRLQVPYDGN